MRYKKKILVCIVLCLFTVAGYSITVVAHPPQNLQLDYDLANQTLAVTITHNSLDPNSHYIYKIDIEKNGVLYLSEEYLDQPTADTFTYNYIVEAAVNDVLAVTAYCSLYGSMSASITVVDKNAEDTTPPTIEIVNPTEGYFHFSGIRLFPTQLDIVADTMGFGGFRVRPVQVRVTDNIDFPQDISVYMYVYEDEQGTMNYNSNSNLHERKWIGPDLGVFTLTITAEDTSNNIASMEMEVWYFCFVPEP
jgi:hypothetical protein